MKNREAIRASITLAEDIVREAARRKAREVKNREVRKAPGPFAAPLRFNPFAALAGMEIETVNREDAKPHFTARQKAEIAQELAADVNSELRRLIRASGGPAANPVARVRYNPGWGKPSKKRSRRRMPWQIEKHSRWYEKGLK